MNEILTMSSFAFSTDHISICIPYFVAERHGKSGHGDGSRFLFYIA